ncbi:MAG: translocation/assembly module TamB domain-containing protein [Bacteriovoracia bacterium]
MRFKSVLGAFLFILLATLVAFIIFIQTKSFGDLVTKVVSDLSERRLQTAVKINSITLSVFPPGLELNKVSVEKNFSPLEKFEAEFGKIGFYINLIEIEEKKLTFGEIRIADSVVNYTFPKKDEELKEIDKKLIERVFQFSDEMPVRVDTLLVENSRVVANHELLEIRRLKLFKKDKSFIARFHVSNINPIPENGFKFDEVWGDAEVSKKTIKIERLKAQHDVHTLLLKGSITNYHLLKNSEVKVVGEAQVHLKSLDNIFPIPEEVKIKGGVAKAGFQIDYKNTALSAKSQIHVDKLRSNLFHADELKTELLYTSEELHLNSFAFTYKDQSATLVKSLVLYNLTDKKFLTGPVKVSLNEVSLNNALRFLGKKLRPLKGSLTGEVTLTYRDKNYYFNPSPNFVVRNLGLVVGEEAKPFKVLMIKKATLNDATFAIVNNEFQMKTRADLPHSSLVVDGYVNKDKVFFNVPESDIDLEDFGNISNLDIKGAGKIAVKVSGPLSEARIAIQGKTNGFEVLGYKLDQTDKNITIDLANSEVIISKMESAFGKTNITGHGTVNYGDAEIALGISTNDTNFTELSQILTPILKDVDFLPDDLGFKAKIDVDIFGKYRLDDLKIKSRVNFEDLVAYGEEVNRGSLIVTLLNKVLSFKNFNAEKDEGRVAGDFQFDLKDKNFKLKYNWDNLQLSSLNLSKRFGLNLDAGISGSIAGGGRPSDFLLKLESLAYNTRTQNYTFGDSQVSMSIFKNRVMGRANVLGNILNTDFNLALSPGVASSLKLQFKSPDLKPFLVAFFGQHLEAENFSGNVEFEGATTFEDGFKNLNLVGILKELTFNHPEFSVNYSSTKPQFKVKNSVVEEWDLNLRQKNLFFVTKGEGVFGKSVSLIHETHFNAKILDILLAPVLAASGDLENIVRIEGRGSEFDLSVTSRSSGLDLSLEQLPVQINKLKYKMEYASRKLEIQTFNTSLDSGTVSIKGDIYFEGTQPDVNLKFNLERAEIPILGKSAINLSGDGIILGNNYPYSVSGEIVVNKAHIVNELNEFSSRSASFSQVRFLPKNQESPLGKMFNLNLNIKAEYPIRIINSLMDVALAGELRLLGSPSRPKAEGRLSAPLNSSRIFFKNNEYQITSADINFSPKKEISNPDFDIQAVTYISTYKVFPKAYGDLERFNFDLTSEPALPRNSILSLIAFGYTDEIQSTLYAKDQQSLTEVGVGSFVFDRFKISDILNKQFGLQVNLGTVIEQSTTDSLLSGRSQESGAGSAATGRTRSATKIELKKRLDDALTLSVSSTMGGSIGQRQSMNLNYGLSKNVQIEGVYELRTEDEADIIYDSIGGDIKFRRTFK